MFTTVFALMFFLSLRGRRLFRGFFFFAYGFGIYCLFVFVSFLFFVLSVNRVIFDSDVFFLGQSLVFRSFFKKDQEPNEPSRFRSSSTEVLPFFGTLKSKRLDFDAPNNNIASLRIGCRAFVFMLRNLAKTR